MELLDTLLADYHIDPQRLYLAGLLMGGFGVCRWPERFAAAAPQTRSSAWNTCGRPGR
jgi:predicted peptidase